MTQNKGQKSKHPPVFDDVVIRLSRKTDGHEVFLAEVRQTPIPLEGGDFRIKSKEQLEAFHQLFTEGVAFNRFFRDSDDLSVLANKLYDLLPISICDELPRLIQEVFEQGRGIRLIIEASASDQADQLLSLPWELLFIRETQVYPARSRRLLIVRRLLDAARHSPVEMSAPFNLVHVIADDPEQKVEDDLQEMERQTIPVSIGTDDYTLLEKPGSVQKWLDVMRQTKHSQILHFLGHGGKPEHSENSFAVRRYLCFVNEKDQRQWVTGKQLQHLLSGTPGLQLIVLSACESASVVTSNIALDLVYSGFPYVVAMQAEMPQEAAKHFIRAFYSQLQEGQSIEYAVAAGRMEIASQLPGAIDWCLPVLYTNVGLAKKPRSLELVERFIQWVRQVDNLFWITVTLGSLHLVVGLLLWFMGESPPLPDTDFMPWTTGWVVIVPPLLAAWIYGSGQLPIPDDWPPLMQFDIDKLWPLKNRLILWLSLLGTGAFSLASLMLCEVWFLVVLFVALGFWGSLSPLAQVLLLIPLLLIAILASYALTLFHGFKFIRTTQIEKHPPLVESVAPPIVGYVILYFSLWLSYGSPEFYTLPQGNLFIGIVFLGVSFALRYWRTEWENDQDGPWSI